MVRVGQPNSARNLRNVCGERAAQVDAVVREAPQVHIIALKTPAMFSGPLALLQDVLAEALRLAGFRGLFMPQLREQGVALDELQGRFELQTDQANTICMV